MRNALSWLLTFLMLMVLAAPAMAQSDAARAADQRSAESLNVVPNPGADLWKEIRRSTSGRSQAQGVQSGVLINSRGEDWREFRMSWLVPYGGWFLGGMLALIATFYLIRGTIRIEGGRSDEVLFRFTVLQRMTHWFMASLFIVLGLTGLALLFGRFVLLPLFGPSGFSIIAAASKEVHNLFGPLFPISILMLLALFGAQNIYEKGDLKWLLKGGGFFGGDHASAGRFNMGEKIFFWLTVGLGLAISISGLILNFPVFGQGREIMAWSHVVHGVVAVVFIGVAFGHMYMGTLGTEGTLDAMKTGYVDRNWAKMHHDRWVREAGNKPQLGSERAVIGAKAEISPEGAGH